LELPGGTNHGGGLVCQLLMGLSSRGLGLEKGVKATTDVEFGIRVMYGAIVVNGVARV